MNASDIALLVRGISPAVRDAVAKAIDARDDALSRRIVALEAELAALKAIGPVRGADGKDGLPGPQGEPGPIGPVGPVGPPGSNGMDGAKGLDGASGRDGIDGKDGRDGQPGLPGRDGAKGLDGEAGAPGRDGVDGLGFDDIVVEHDGERTFTIKFVRGDRVKDCGRFSVPMPIYRGVFQPGKAYEAHDEVTWGGSVFQALKDTTAKPGESGSESRSWVLKVKRGGDGKQGPTGPQGPMGLRGEQGPPGRASY